MSLEENLTPRRIVEELDKYIIGQAKAKKAVAIALRNRYRRMKLSEEMRDEVLPKNILMIGPTGVGKTEIARRLAKLVGSPFVKVEATKFTEVGYVGRDVESMARDLVETAIRMVRAERMEAVQEKAESMVNDRLLDILVPLPKEGNFSNPLSVFFGGMGGTRSVEDESQREKEKKNRREREILAQRLANGELEDETIEIEVDDNALPMLELFPGAGIEEMGINLQDIFGNVLPKKKKKRKVTIAAARNILAQQEAEKLIDMDDAINEAIRRAEESGIIFVDEMDKIASKETSAGPDVSREGVQRDILPLVEGSTVMTKYGPIKTDHILFIAAGAFHVCKPSDLIPELQGRFPIRVELNSLSKEDFKRILTEPRNALIKQYKALLSTEGVNLEFSADAIEEIAEIAYQVNEGTENIGARRLYTILEKVLEELSFEAPNIVDTDVAIDREYVRKRLERVSRDQDLSRYIL